ncbi:GTP cyclohydrolase II [Sphingomonas piscis]|uniref:GTP cyclohydrolase-2 n=1 Tax=Sphingomonas piscis TaxID=2714943 RepID=A0A6G7YPL5_9SPHN|nr:GTP cyclohydrolase II [Sphingomonas piscis]QIK78688.1 GTP cyclohydrolase II [Sphingomonas piscis]
MSGALLEEAIAALRAGRPVGVGDHSFAAVETFTDSTLALLDPHQSARLLISGTRAAAVYLANDLNAADPHQPVAIQRADWLDRQGALSIADPGQDLDRAPLGPLTTVPLSAEDEAAAALELARLAGLLPALWLLPAGETALTVNPSDLLGHRPGVSLTARAKLPLEGLPPTQIVVFRAAGDGQEHVALVIGAFGGQPPLVRLHSECLTGDVFGSLKCDCGPQLHEALRIIGASGGGILLYLRQEGRGIGIANKIRAYALQDRGLDTVDANRRLGFGDDARGYGDAAAMLKALGADRVRLLTNNPSKVEGLVAAGVEVVERVAHHMPANPHNADYLATKRRKSGHLA